MNPRILMICSEFNKEITQSLLNGAVSYFVQKNILETQLKVIWVPGAFEIATVASAGAKSKKYDAIVCLGAVIRGETSHYDLIINNCSQQLASIGSSTGIPTIFGVLSTNNLQQAYERCGIKGPNHGIYFAEAAVKMMVALKEVGE